jgi:CheY-like chemotaxis protein
MTADQSTGEDVLIIEDDTDLRETLAALLDEEGFEVATAANGQEALEHLRKSRRPRLILLDLMMPVMDGWEFRQRQQQDPRLADIPVAVVSAVGAMGLQADFLDAAAYLPKPLELTRLRSVVARFCQSRQPHLAAAVH